MSAIIVYVHVCSYAPYNLLLFYSTYNCMLVYVTEWVNYIIPLAYTECFALLTS